MIARAGTFTGVVLITVALLPVVALAGWALVRRSQWERAVEIGIVYGTTPWVWMIMLPGSQAGDVPGRVSLVPLHDLIEVVEAGPVSAIGQIGGNLLVFAALGFLVPIRFAALASVPRILALAAACSMVVETAQYAFQLDRVSSVDDVLINAAGAGLAALASRRWWRTYDGSGSAVRAGQF
ncbi:MAG: VanZ family protein [Actinoplanes sp.]